MITCDVYAHKLHVYIHCIFHNMADVAWVVGIYEMADLYRFQLRLPCKNVEALLSNKLRAGRCGKNRLTFIISFSKSQ